jgi:hypothetical protein
MGVEKLANDAIGYVRRGGTRRLMIYGVCENKALVHWPPSKIFGDEIQVRRPCSRTRLSAPILIIISPTDLQFVFAGILLSAYLDIKKINVTGMVFFPMLHPCR